MNQFVAPADYNPISRDRGRRIKRKLSIRVLITPAYPARIQVDHQDFVIEGSVESGSASQRRRCAGVGVGRNAEHLFAR